MAVAIRASRRRGAGLAVVCLVAFAAVAGLVGSRVLLHPGIAVVGLASLYKWHEFSAGGSAVAESVGGRRIDPHTTELRERKLLNVVEEMAIASGIPMPTVYVLEEEPGINAFAAGLTTSDAVVAASRVRKSLWARLTVATSTPFPKKPEPVCWLNAVASSTLSPFARVTFITSTLSLLSSSTSRALVGVKPTSGICQSDVRKV